MQVVELPVQVTISGLLRAVETLSDDDLDHFLAQARLIQQRSRNEFTLLAIVYSKLSEPESVRLAGLTRKLEDEALTETERAELLALVETAETIDAERAEALWALAQQRRVTLDQLLHDLNLETHIG